MQKKTRQNLFSLIFCSKTNEEFRKQMNGLKMISENEINPINYQTFSALPNLVVPDSVGKLVLVIIMFDVSSI